MPTYEFNLPEVAAKIRENLIRYGMLQYTVGYRKSNVIYFAFLSIMNSGFSLIYPRYVSWVTIGCGIVWCVLAVASWRILKRAEADVADFRAGTFPADFSFEVDIPDGQPALPRDRQTVAQETEETRQ